MYHWKSYVKSSPRTLDVISQVPAVLTEDLALPPVTLLPCVRGWHRVEGL